MPMFSDSRILSPLRAALAAMALSATASMAAAAAAADTLTLSLDDAIARARANSVDAAVALDELRQAYWEYRTYRADLLPEVTFNATLPAYYKQYTSYMDADGAYSFVRNNYLQMNGSIAVCQSIWPTGGTLSLTTSLDFYRDLDQVVAGNRFMSIPVALTLNQPVFGVNHTKWRRRIEPERYAEAKAAFLSASEDVALQAIDLYFSLLLAVENHRIALQNLDNASRLYEVAREKREMGQISRNDLLQMELNRLDATSELTDCESALKQAMFTLRAFLDLPESVDISPVMPARTPCAEITYADALERALTNNKFARNVRRRQLEADYAVASAKGDLREIRLFARVGFTGTDSGIGQAYRRLHDNQGVELGLSIPLLDWGKRRGKVKVAESNRRVVESTIRRETMDFNQDIFILVERFNNQRRQLDIARRADEIAAQRYATNVETFMIGRISTLDLNDSQAKKDSARQNFVNQLFRYWSYYYRLRSLTLWDYELHTGIDADFSRILRQ